MFNQVVTKPGHKTQSPLRDRAEHYAHIFYWFLFLLGCVGGSMSSSRAWIRDEDGRALAMRSPQLKSLPGYLGE